MNILTFRVMQVIKFFVDANFYISVLVLAYGGFSAITENYTVFEFSEDLFGAMHNNLRIALFFLAMTEVVVCVYCFFEKKPKIMLFVGYFLIMMMGSMAFYGQINNVPVDGDLYWFLLYTGASHIIFGLVSGVRSSDAENYS